MQSGSGCSQPSICCNEEIHPGTHSRANTGRDGDRSVDRDRSRALLTHHFKLERWLQLGGHADGDTDILRVALREAREESGVNDIKPVSEAVFDVDVHPIPARGTEPRHLHYDVRFLLEADPTTPLVISSESKDLAWVSFEEITNLTTERSIARMVAKSLQHKGQ